MGSTLKGRAGLRGMLGSLGDAGVFAFAGHVGVSC